MSHAPIVPVISRGGAFCFFIKILLEYGDFLLHASLAHRIKVIESVTSDIRVNDENRVLHTRYDNRWCGSRFAAYVK